MASSSIVWAGEMNPAPVQCAWAVLPSIRNVAQFYRLQSVPGVDRPSRFLASKKQRKEGPFSGVSSSSSISGMLCYDAPPGKEGSEGLQAGTMSTAALTFCPK